MILPQLERDDLYQRYDFGQPWNSQHNLELADEMPLVFACPDDDRARRKYTSYVAVVGPNNAFGPGRTSQRAAVADPAATTVLAMEWINSGICWLEPRDGPPRPGARLTMPPLPDHGTFGVLYADGQVRSFPATISPREFEALLTVTGDDGVAP